VKGTLTAIVLFVVISNFASAQQSGSVCIASRVDDPFWKEPRILPNGEINSHGLKVRIDKKQMEWPPRKALKIAVPDLKERHLLVVLDSDHKPIESVWFKFSDFKNPDLCMSYDGYQGISLLEASRKTPWCKCAKTSINNNDPY